MTDFARFAEPIEGDSPCGPDCEYDNDFLALSLAVVGKPEQQFGDAVIPAVEPDWREVNTLAEALLGRTRDLRIVVWLMLANTHIHGVSAFANGLKLIVALCERYWDTIHPRIEVDGDTDPYLRMNAISSVSVPEFSDENPLIKALRTSVLTRNPAVLTYRDVEFGLSNSAESAFSKAQVESIISDALATSNAEIPLVVEAWQNYQALKKFLDERVTEGEPPDLERLGAVLKPVAQGISRMQSAEASDGVRSDSESSGNADATADGGSTTPGISGQVKSREDAQRALQRVCEYLERNEPSNPASLFARRAQRLLAMPFMDIMRELSPDSMAHLEMLTGAPRASDS